MRFNKEDTPPSSISGDEIAGMDEEGIVYLDDMEEITFDEFEQAMGQEDDTEMGERPEDMSSVVFDKHSGSIFCCDLHPDGKLAVTGGEDDKAFVWSVDSGQVIMECTGHKDSVVFAGFSFDGTYLATADMGGIIKVWKCNLSGEQTEPWTVAFEYECDDFTWGQWHFGTRVLMCGTASGNIYIFKIPSGDTKILQGHNQKVECAKLFNDGFRLVVGYEDGAVKVWDLKTNSVSQQIPATVHQTRVIAVDTHPENNIFVSISIDGKAILASANNGKIVGELQTENDLETVAFLQDPQLGYLALGTLNGSVTIWDISRKMIRNHCSKSDVNGDGDGGVTKMLWVKKQLVTSCLDGSIRVYDGRSGERNVVLTGHWAEILDLSYNEKEGILLSTSDDGARIHKYDLKDND